MTDPTIPPPGIAPAQPSIARMYDYAVFGTNNYEIDRAAVHQTLETDPSIIWMARENRAFLGRVVRYLSQERGIHQFIDHGSGLPAQQNVHQVAQRYDPGAQVVYVDNDPVVLAHGRALLADNDSTIIITADMGRPEELLANRDARQLIDFEQPVGLLYISVLHCLTDQQDPWGAVRRMMAAVPSGSYLAVSSITTSTPEHAEAVTADMLAADPNWGRVRMPEEIDRFLDGLEVVPPGLGDIASWRLDLGPAVIPRPDAPVEWPPEWGDDAVDPAAPRTIWEHGGVARKL